MVAASVAGADLVVYTVAAALQIKDSPQYGMVCWKQWILNVLQRRPVVAKLHRAQLPAIPGRLRTASVVKAPQAHH